MNSKELLRGWFEASGDDMKVGETIGAEVETSVVGEDGQPITVEKSQEIFRLLATSGREWTVRTRKGNLVTEIVHDHVGSMLYELGRQNIEIATLPATSRERCQGKVFQGIWDLKWAAEEVGARLWHRPIINTDEDLLVIPDERDATWLDLDGREALTLLTKCSAVQFTVGVPRSRAIGVINRLGDRIDDFLKDYPQEALWRDYIATSKAGYRPDRYGGPLHFRDLEHYCEELVRHDVVQNGRLVPHSEIADLDIPLFLRSVWWYFRLKKYGRRLAIEVRPMPRREDAYIFEQLDTVLQIMGQ